MPPTGFHSILGLLLARRMNSQPDLLKIGLVFGSSLPDIDILGSALIFLFTQDSVMTIAFHRSVTHSLVTIVTILLGGFLIDQIHIRRKAAETFMPFILGLTGGMLIHSFLDFFYFDGVSIFWPLQPFGQRVHILPFTFEDLPSIANNLLAKIFFTLDGHFELVYYLMLVHLALRLNTDSVIIFKGFKIVEWPRKLRSIAYFLILQMIFFLGLAVLSISWFSFDRNLFAMIVTIPLLPMYLLTVILPLLMRKTIVTQEYIT